MAASSGQPDCALLNVHAYPGQCRNATTASATTRNHKKIEVSLCPAPPPLPSKLYVHCPELRLTVLPRVISAVEDLFLLRVAVDCRPDASSWPEDSDYFIYRAGGGGTESPSLQRLARLHPFFHDDDVGVLGRGANYTVAVLMGTGTPVYDLHILHSENPTEWIYHMVSVTEPPRRFPLLIPENCGRLLYHETSTIISIGGEAGTMGWVDLWHGILLCDVLRDEPTLRGVPMPIPLELVCCDNGQGTELGCPIPFRGIAFVKLGCGDTPHDCLKLVHLAPKASLLPAVDNETGSLNFQMHDWTIITYTNTAMTSSWNRKDWHRDCWLRASDFTVDTQVNSDLLQSGLLGSSSGQGLQNLLVSHPATAISSASASGKGVVYLMARKKYRHPELWALALDTRKKKLLGVAEFGTERQPGPPVAMYFPSSIAKYIKPDTDTDTGV
ncbi:hypothetical protein BS78_03G338500 [Paspalum vaginatum]|nr:hypothetical protein BS78_03G338500 [Paspalum vaginatum]